jgi:hypothetical protein
MPSITPINTFFTPRVLYKTQFPDDENIFLGCSTHVSWFVLHFILLLVSILLFVIWRGSIDFVYLSIAYCHDE